MLKSILLFMRAHIVVTTITTTVVVGAIVATPIAIEIYKTYQLDKTIQEGINMLGKSDRSSIVEDTTQNTDVSTNANYNEPLTFRIEKKEEHTEGGNIVKNMEGEDAYEMGSKEVTYEIIPSYDKDISQWTKEEKEEYAKLLEEVAKMAKKQYESDAASEAKKMQEIMEEYAKIEAGQTERLGCAGVAAISCNSYKRTYSGEYMSGITYVTDEYGGTCGESNWETFEDMPAEEFRNNIYPIILKNIMDEKGAYPEDEWIEGKANLEKLYHLTD